MLLYFLEFNFTGLKYTYNIIISKKTFQTFTC